MTNNDISFFSEEGENIVDSMNFQIEKCNPNENKPGFCKTDKEINDYIKDLQVQLILVEQSHDLNEFGKKAVKKS